MRRSTDIALIIRDHVGIIYSTPIDTFRDNGAYRRDETKIPAVIIAAIILVFESVTSEIRFT